MAELGIAGLVLAIPGVILHCIQCGEYLYNLTNKFKSASESVRQIRAFSYELSHGRLKVSLELTEKVDIDPELDEHLKNAVRASLQQLQIALATVKSTLETFLDKDGKIRRMYFAFRGERKIQHELNELRQWQREFEGLIDLIYKRRALARHDLRLTRATFRIIHRAEEPEYRPIPGTQMVLAEGEYSTGRPEQVSVLIERSEQIMAGSTSEDIRQIPSILAMHLHTGTSSRGILHCLGYRDANGMELVFRLPALTKRVRTLRTVIESPTARIYGGYALEERLRLCRSLSEAVLSVHSSGLVHKNIRSNTVVFIEHGDESDGRAREGHLGSPFLTEWSMMRKVSDLSSRRGSDDWKDDIYRHPRRQGRQPEERYNMGHDLYSLAVILLEFVLWEPFVNMDLHPPISRAFNEKAQILGNLRAEDCTSIDKLTSPLLKHKVMKALADEEVAPRMGTRLAVFISACLNCFDGGFPSITEQDFRERPDATALQFAEMISQTFSNV